MKYKIAFLGTPNFAAQILENLIDTPFKPQLVITGQDKKTGRSQALKANPVKLVAQKHNIAISYELSDIDKTFDVAILVAFGKIIPDNILSLPKFGFINVHPSLLPYFRGPSPIQSAILKGEQTTGVTLIILDSELDHGPQIAQKEIEITTDDTNETLTKKLAGNGAKLLLQTLPQYLAQNITPLPQNHKLATYTEKITKDSGKLNLDKLPPSSSLDLMIRAFYPWPGVWFEFERKRYKLLPENKIQPEGKRPMTITEFKNGYQHIYEKIEKIF